MISEQPRAVDIEERFLDYLTGFDRGALADLRRGLGVELNEATSMHRYIVPWLPSERRWRGDDAAFYLVASLYAVHRKHVLGVGNLGAALGALRDEKRRNGGEKGVERRFDALIGAAREDLPEHLRHAIALLPERPVDFAQLLRDVRRWSSDSRAVQLRWAEAFWGPRGSLADDGRPGNDTAADAAQAN